jgi:hypothetical protein
MKYVSTELRENEVFIANTSNIENFPRPELKILKTIRMGDQALDINGNKLATDYCRPIFIHKDELDLYDKIMTKLHSLL